MQGGFDKTQRPSMAGNTETIEMRDGSAAVTRVWDATKGEYRFTTVGARFYNNLHRNYVAQIPVIAKGKRANGTTYEYNSVFPAEKLNITSKKMLLSMGSPTRMAKV